MSKDVPSIDSIFCAAIELDSGEERAAYLDQACSGDIELRRRVDKLLDAHFRAGSFLESPAPALNATIHQPISEEPGTIIGPFKLLEQIGEGGMGVVYMADQQMPVRRRVALKIIKPGMDTRQVIARFEAERQALALMDHSNIARVFDAGTTDSGRPYFVMELVRGVAITEYCDKNNLPVHERLELFVQVCQAVQHAHQKGIIHRDIKPSNVLVTLVDGRAVPKVIDFGVAKAISQQLTEKTLFTNFAQMIGTPLYMSPEQAEMTSIDVDTRSDIYSLGVLLYELLTGTTPFDQKRFREAALDEVRRIIREEDPPQPSTRISTLGDQRTVTAIHRKMDPNRLSQLLRGDLDWIVMKSIEKDRTHRYETANALVRDVQRYLANEPVEACPPSAMYRFRKFARRNRAALTTAVLVAGALVAGTAVSTWQAVRAMRAERFAEIEQAEAESQRKQAEVNFQQARRAVDEYFTLVSENQLLEVPGLESLRNDLMEAALRFYKRFADQRTADPAALADLAITYSQLGEIYSSTDRNDEAVLVLGRSLDIVDRLLRDYPEAKADHRRLSGLTRGRRDAQTIETMPRDLDTTQKLLERMIATWRKLADDNPDVPAFQSDIASSYVKLGWVFGTARAAEALGAFADARRILEKLRQEYPARPEYWCELPRCFGGQIWALERLGRTREVGPLRDQALEVCEKLVMAYPAVPQHRAALALNLMWSGKARALLHPRDAEEKSRRAVELMDTLVAEFPGAPIYRGDLCVALVNLGEILDKIGKSSEAAAVRRRAIDSSRSLLTDTSTNVQRRAAIVKVIFRTAKWSAKIAPEEAEKRYRRVIEIEEALVDEFPTVPSYRSELSTAMGELTELLKVTNNQMAIDQIWGPALEKAEKHLALHPQDFLTLEFFGNGLCWYGGHGAPDTQECVRKAIVAFETLLADSPGGRRHLRTLCEIRRWHADLLIGAGQVQDAAQDYRRGIEIATEVLTESPAQPDVEMVLAACQQGLAGTYSAAGQYADAEQVLHKSLQLLEKGAGRDAVGAPYETLADLYAKSERISEAIEAQQKAVAAWERLATKTKEHGNRWRLGGAYDHLGDLLRKANNTQDAEAVLLKSVAVWEKLAAETDERDHRWHLACTYEQLGDLLRQVNRAEEAVVLYPRAGALWEKLVREDQNSEDYRLHQQWNRSWLAETYNNMAWQLVASSDAEPQKLDQAIDLARKAVDLAPSAANCMSTLGVAFYRAGKWEDAIRSLANAEELAPEKTLAHNGFFLAMAHWQADNQDEARKWYDRSVEWMEKNAPQNEELVRFRHEAKDLLAGKPALDADSESRD